MSPAEFSVRLQHGQSFISHKYMSLIPISLGITGGFAPPTPSAIYTLNTVSKQPTINVTAAVRPDGTPSLQDALPKTLTQDDHTAALVNELTSILKSLPVESPPGSQDIYGLDTSIAFARDDFMWMNGGPQGCGGGISEIQATAEDKVKFKRAVEIVNELVNKAV